MPDYSDIDDPVEKLNRLPTDEARAVLLDCCGSTRWAESVAANRPYWDVGQCLIIGERIWKELERDDWLEAFRAHPKIGERKAEAVASQKAQSWSEGEQSRASDAASETLDALAAANREYEAKFGFIFIVCASGKTADEMLALLRDRMSNDIDTELRVAAGEQWLITQLRIKKFLKVI
ncbi:MAG TPA: 2-oxo-4-hydroxy-4-carboxy-5-ureidoimidazoline decarboxylase [Pyrinomonadaceae bacterium]|nr:2-oxo-4-hydroxy-4-carboxy-5-ureidoimidazoline decarboxylase [Pyrinomonadaceae bacterium]